MAVVDVTPASFAAVFAAGAAGDTYRFASGTYPQLSISPRAGDNYIAAPNSTVILDGETVTVFAFNPTADNVTIDGLEIKRYSHIRDGAINGRNRIGWTVTRCWTHSNNGSGMTIGRNWQVDHNRITNNRILGFQSDGGNTPGNTIVEYNEIAGNFTQADDNWLNEGGGTKFSAYNGLTVRHNWSHDNLAPGLWFDEGNSNVTIESNLCENNTYRAIFYEISATAIIRWNTIRGTFGPGSFGDGIAIDVSNSSFVEVYGNAVDNNQTGIWARSQDRGGAVLDNVDVHDNDSRQTAGFCGVFADHDAVRVYSDPDIRYRTNTYRVDTGGLRWYHDGSPVSFATWQTRGYDTAGTVLAATSAPQIGTGGVAFQTASYGPPPVVSTVFPDDFNRTDGATLAANGWTVVAGAPVSSGAALRHVVVGAATTTTAVREAVYAADSHAAQIAWSVTIGSSTTAHLRVGVRLATTAPDGDGYWFEHARVNGTTSARLYKVVGGVVTNLSTTGTGPANPTAGQAIRIEASGSTIRGYVNNTLVRTATDTTFIGATRRRGGLSVFSPASINIADNYTGFLVAPAVPTELTLTIDDQQITATWAAGVGATAHLLRWQPTGATTWTVIDPAVTPQSISGLTNGTSYAVQVAGRNTAGDSAWSATVSATPGAPIYGVPSTLADNFNRANASTIGPNWALLGPSGSIFSNSWAPPSSGTVLHRRELLLRTDDQIVSVRNVLTVSAGTASTILMARIGNEAFLPRYTLVQPTAAGVAQPMFVNRDNLDGTNTRIATGPATPILAGQTVKLQVVGPVVIGYVNDVEAFRGTDPNPIVGVAYRKVGFGGVRNGVDTRMDDFAARDLVPGAAPTTPTGVTMETPEASTIVVRWTVVDYDDSGYVIRYRRTGTTPWSTVTAPALADSVTVAGLVNGVGYEADVTAVNPAGSSPPSAIVSVVTGQVLFGGLSAIGVGGPSYQELAGVAPPPPSPSGVPRIMVVTDSGPLPLSRVGRWNGTEIVPGRLFRWNGLILEES